MIPVGTLDGRTFEPRWGEVETRRAPRQVFSEQDRQRLAADPHVRPYLTITQIEVAGLLYALGRGAGRVYPYDPDFFGSQSAIDADALEASRALGRIYDDLDYGYSHVRAPAPPPDPHAVFDAPEQDELSFRKNIRGLERITREQLMRLLRAVDQYAIRAPYMDVFAFGPDYIMSRWLQAHNVLVAFRERPMPLEEFSEQVQLLMSEVSRRRKEQGWT